MISIYNRPDPVDVENFRIPKKRKRRKKNVKEKKKVWFTPIEGEQWRPVPGTLNEYEVSDLGRLRRNKCCNRHGDSYTLLVKPNIVRGLYRHRLYLASGSTKIIYLHKTIKESFEPNSENLTVYHLNGNPLDNRLTNLGYRKRQRGNVNSRLKAIDYVSASGEVKKRRSKVSVGDIEQVHKMAKAGMTQTQISKQLNISQPYVCYLLNTGIRIVNGTACRYRISAHDQK
jgi:hypothetical protein